MVAVRLVAFTDHCRTGLQSVFSYPSVVDKQKHPTKRHFPGNYQEVVRRLFFAFSLWPLTVVEAVGGRK